MMDLVRLRRIVTLVISSGSSRSTPYRDNPLVTDTDDLEDSDWIFSIVFDEQVAQANAAARLPC